MCRSSGARSASPVVRRRVPPAKSIMSDGAPPLALLAGIGRVGRDVENRLAVHLAVPHLAHGLGDLVPAAAPADLNDEVTRREKVHERPQVGTHRTAGEVGTQRLSGPDRGVGGEDRWLARGPADALKAPARYQEAPGLDHLRSADGVEDRVDGLVDPVESYHDISGAVLTQAAAASGRADGGDDMRTCAAGELDRISCPRRLRR